MGFEGIDRRKQPRTRVPSQPSDEAVDADFAAALADLGLSQETAWRLSATLYGVGGLLSICCGLLLPQVSPLIYLGAFAMVVGGMCVWAARRVPHTRWAIHARLMTGVIIFATAAALLGPKATAFALFPLLTIPSPCYLSTPRAAFLYSSSATTIIFVTLMTIEGDAYVARAIISAVVVALTSVGLFLTRQRMRLVARHNRELAYTDPLTGAANVRRLREAIATSIARTPEGGRADFALFAVDLDNFKQVNDRFDHSRGDLVLRTVADELRAELEDGDMLVRRGGDEFSILIPEPGDRNLGDLRERLAAAIVRARLATCPEVSPSGGVAYVRAARGDDSATVMERADAELHDAKIAPREAGPPLTAELIPLDRVKEPPPEHEAGRLFDKTDATWRVLAAQMLPMPLLLGLLTVTGLLDPLSISAGLSAALAFAGLFAVAVLLDRRKTPRWVAHPVWLTVFGVLAMTVALAGSAGTALLDFFAMFALGGFLLFRTKAALAYMLLADVLFAAFAIGGGVASAVARTVVMAVIVGLVGGVVSKLRQATVHFVRTNLELSERDALTGLGNLRALRARLADASTRPAHAGSVLVAIDLDWFKAVNDQYSHTTGDAVLTAVARAIEETVCADDLVARRGGDEFYAVLTNASPEDAHGVAERVRAAISRARLRICPDIQPTASVAVVECGPGAGADDLIHRADLALHEEKTRARSTRRLSATA